MSVDLLSLISKFHSFEDRESEVAWFRTLVPWVAPEAYLNVVYKPAPSGLLSGIARKWSFPLSLVDVLRQQNGAILFSGALSLFGVVDAGRLLDRQDPFSLPPFNIESENASWSLQRDQLLVVGGYQFDGSKACIDREDGKIHVFKRRQKTPSVSWSSLESWLTDEVKRLCLAFDDRGMRTKPESETGPPQSVTVN